MAIEPEADPVSWLARSHGDLCVRLLFWQLLDALRSNLLGLSRAASQSSGSIDLAYLEGRLGYRLNNSDLSLLGPLANMHPLKADMGDLLNIFSRLSRAIVGSPRNKPMVKHVELRNQLLSLSGADDPLLLLRRQYLDVAAESTLQYLVDLVFPYSKRSAINQLPPERLFPKLPPIRCSDRGIDFDISRMVTMSDVWVVEISFVASREQVSHIEPKAEGQSAWLGIPSIADDLGNRYLVSGYAGQMGVSFPNKWEMRYAVYPLIAATAKIFTLAFEHVQLTLEEREPRDMHPANDVTTFYDIHLEHLNWEIDIASLRAQHAGFY